ncbi:hypothetical protein [Fusobacterium sp. MFO224]|uniref:hypothetical protein n=1 Tax=Fusobacterium sp. MFO224 TaxID=3378070 RepID=UPI00385379C6
MDIKKLNKIIVIIMTIITFSGCTSLTTYIGEKRIESGLQIYNSSGVTSYGVKKLASGLKYLPDSIVGVECFNKQSLEIIKEKDNILKKKYPSINDIERLKTYIILNEEAIKINSKVKNLKFDYSSYMSSRKKIDVIFEKYVVRDNKNSINLPRTKKIEKINYYKDLNTYINSSIIYDIIYSLENQVTKRVYLTSSFMRYNYINSMVSEALFDFSAKNKNHEIEKYVYFDSYSEIPPRKSNQYLVVMNFLECRTYSKGLIVEKKFDREIVTEHKELIIRGNYRLLTNDNINFSKSKHFKIQKNYDVITEKYKNRIIYGNVRKEIENILKDKFDKVIVNDLKDLI